MSNSYVLGIAVGIAFGIMFVAFIFSYLYKGCLHPDEGRLTVGWINFFAAALLIIIDIIYAIDVIIKRSRAVEPDEED